MIAYFTLVTFMLPPMVMVPDNSKIAEMHRVATQIRKDRGLDSQELSKDLCQVSQKWAEHLAENHYFYHGGGENVIAVGYKTPQAAFNGWLSSPGHRYWILSNTDQCGWGAAKSSNGTWYWVGTFRSSKVVESPTGTYVPKRLFRFFGRR